MRYFIIIFLIVLDQIAKYFAVINIKDKASIEVVPNILRFSYVENTGAAFGILRDAQWFFIISTVIISITAIIYFEKNIYKMKDKVYVVVYILIIAGAFGNLIDRIAHRYVVDFIDFYTINYPVFNIADSFVCIGCAILMWKVMFGKEGDTTLNKTDA